MAISSVDFKLDSGGCAEVLNSGAVAAAVRALAEGIAGGARGSHPGADVVVDSYRTDRACASVTIRDVRGKLWQARDGVLSRSASGAGVSIGGG
jgi:hypothetical protein